MLAIARAKTGQQEPDWALFRYEAVDGGDVLVEGSFFTHFKSGKRKGCRKFAGPSRKCVITPADRAAEMFRYESDTGHCCECGNTGQRYHGFGPDGTRYKPCPRCNATGIAPGLRK